MATRRPGIEYVHIFLFAPPRDRGKRFFHPRYLTRTCYRFQRPVRSYVQPHSHRGAIPRDRHASAEDLDHAFIAEHLTRVVCDPRMAGYWPGYLRMRGGEELQEAIAITRGMGGVDGGSNRGGGLSGT